jgi:hypothetical protein
MTLGASMARRPSTCWPPPTLEAFIKAAVAVLPRVQQYEANIAVEHTHRSEFDIELTDFAMAYEKFGKVIGADERLLELQIERDEKGEERDEHD